MNQKPKPKQNRPKVSVILSTYNRAEEFLPRAIESVLNQSVKDLELIIVDDASTDETKSVIKQYWDKDKRIFGIHLGKNTGSDTHPKNMGIAAATGEYIAYIDDDVEWTSYHLEVLLKPFELDPTLDVAFCESILIQDGKEKGKAICPCQIFGKPDFDAQFLLRRNYIDTSQVMHKRDLAFAVGGFDERLPKFIDWNMWVRMMKWGAKFLHVAIPATYYYIHEDTKSARIKTKNWFDEEFGITMFEPTFNPSGCYIYLPYLGNDRREEIDPRVAIYTITYDRLDYTKRMVESLRKSTKYPFDWCVFDNGSRDGTTEWIPKQTQYWSGASTNKGISYASNHLLDLIQDKIKPQIIVKVDNDCEFKTVSWLEDFIDLWKRNHMIYASPYPEGLVDNPGGGPRVGQAWIGPYYAEVAKHIGGLCAFIDARAYREFRFKDKFYHGNQDWEASEAFRKMRYMPVYIPQHRIMHMDSKEGQYAKYPEYFERRKTEKTTHAQI